MPQENEYRYGGFDPAVYPTLADMRADPDYTTTGYPVAILTGGAAAFDVTPSGVYVWNPDSAAADNGTTVIAVTANTGNGRWIRVAS